MTLPRATLKLMPALSPVERTPARAKPLVPVSWCVSGQLVYAPKHKRGMILCVVVCTGGYRARVVNKLHGIDGWFHMDSLRVRKDSYFAMR